MPETTRLKKTIDTWWPAIATFIRIRATNAKTEAANAQHAESRRPGLTPSKAARPRSAAHGGAGQRHRAGEPLGVQVADDGGA